MLVSYHKFQQFMKIYNREIAEQKSEKDLKEWRLIYPLDPPRDSNPTNLNYYIIPRTEFPSVDPITLDVRNSIFFHEKKEK